MPVYLLTIHAYRSWSEDNPLGYVQRDEGLQPPNSNLARWRRDHSSHPPFRFDSNQQELAHRIIVQACADHVLRLHAASTTPTHVHTLASFATPACDCSGSKYCAADCAARRHAEAFAADFKRSLGYQLAVQASTQGRPYLSRGWDLTPVRDRQHFDRLITEYLPDHQQTQGGIFRHYP